jgi:TPR repeat protein
MSKSSARIDETKPKPALVTAKIIASFEEAKKLFIGNGGKKGVTKDPNAAFKILKQIAPQYDLAQLELANCHAAGKGTPRNLLTAINTYQKVLHLPLAKWKLACIYRDGGPGIKSNPQQAFTFFNEVADECPEAAVDLAECHARGVGTVPDINGAIRLYEGVITKLNKSELSKATNRLEQLKKMIKLNEEKEIPPSSRPKTISDAKMRLVKEPASLSDEEKRQLIKKHRSKFQGLQRRDEIKAIYELQKAADLGDAWAQYRYACYLDKRKDPSAAKYAKKAADQEYSDAIFLLARYYEKGTFVTENPTEAFRLYNLIHRTDLEATLKVAQFLALGTGTEPDFDLAKSYFEFILNSPSATSELKQIARGDLKQMNSDLSSAAFYNSAVTIKIQTGMGVSSLQGSSIPSSSAENKYRLLSPPSHNNKKTTHLTPPTQPSKGSVPNIK